MQDQDLYYASQYHQRLVNLSTLEHALHETRPDRPSVRDYILLRTGTYLISLGLRLRSASVYQLEQPVDLTQECA